MLGIGLGGALFGFAEKTFGASIPQIPILGRKGAITLGLFFLGKHMGGSFVKDAAVAGAAICGYELGKDGKVSGIDGDIDGDVAANVSGVATQF